MTAKEPANDWLRKLMTNTLDGYLAVHRFDRKIKSNKYIRTINDVKQEIEMTTFYRPHYAKEAYAHIYPNLTIVCPKINKIAFDLVGDKNLLANAPDITLRQPIELVATKDRRERWFLLEENSIVTVGQSLIKFIDNWVIRFLNDYSSPEGIIRCFEANDDRVLNQEQWFIRIAACYVVLNRVEDAKKVVATRFSRQASRRRYERAFEYLENVGHEV